mmetsp:Transcript_14282/g.42583  ORF Transcript_14282/g.42583 Transcript_14282/m.42583 type:complete len:400 (+) Transcript_14282:1378-2577(+)
MREGEVLHDLQPGEEAEQGHDVGRRAHPWHKLTDGEEHLRVADDLGREVRLDRRRRVGIDVAHHVDEEEEEHEQVDPRPEELEVFEAVLVDEPGRVDQEHQHQGAGQHEEEEGPGEVVGLHQRQGHREGSERKGFLLLDDAAGGGELEEQPGVHEDVHIEVQCGELNDHRARPEVQPVPGVQLGEATLRAGQVHRHVNDEAAARVGAMVAIHRDLVGLVLAVPLVVLVEMLGRPAALPRSLALIACVVRREAVELLAPERHLAAALVELRPLLPDADGADQHGGRRVPNEARGPVHDAVLQPEHGRRQDDGRVELPVREGLGHEVILQPSHQRVRVHDVVHATAPAISVAGAAGPEVVLLPSALVEVRGPLLNDEHGEAGEEERVEDGLTEHELHGLVL